MVRVGRFGMKKQAILIIAHKQFELLNMTLRLLDSAYFDFYIHIDKKSGPIDTEAITDGVRESSVYFIKRIPVTWGAYSLIKAELELLSAAIQNEYSYYHLISGQDLPIKTSEEIYRFFENSGGKQFVNFRYSDDNIPKRIKYYYIFQERRGKLNNAIWDFTDKTSRALQKLCHVNRLSDNRKIYYGSQWFSITHEMTTYVCSKQEEIRKRFSHGLGADELFLQTIIMNSGIDWNLSAPVSDPDYISCMRFVDWKNGNPYIIQLNDFEQLIHSGFMFARKFDLDVDKEICEKLFDFLSADSGNSILNQEQ